MNNYKSCINSVISLKEEHLDLLLLMFPTFSYTPFGTKHKNFISVHDVNSKIERMSLGAEYENYIIVSTRIFDFEVKEMDLIEYSLQFRREKFKSRKRSLALDIHSETFVDELYDYITVGELPSDNDQVLELFSLVGTKSFSSKYLEVCESVPTLRVNKAIITFLSKVQSHSESLFYKKARVRIGKKLNKNLLHALRSTNRISLNEGQIQLNFIHAHQLLFEC